MHQGEVSRARQVLCSQAKAPGNQVTLNELRHPERRPPQLSEAIPPEVSGHCPLHQFKLDWRKYACNLHSVVHPGSAAGLAGDTNEHLKVLLDDKKALLLIMEAVEHLSTADLPKEIADAIGLGSLTALLKENGSIRGIVTGDTFRRGVARTMAQQCAKIFEEACMPCQYALSTRAGTDCVARVVRLLTELDPKKTLLSIDGIGAFDHIKRKSMLEALHNNPVLVPLLPFVRTFYGKNSTYVWYDDEGVPHEISQGEGGEQGRGQPHAGVTCSGSARSSRSRGRYTFLDDICILCDPSRVGEIFLQVKQSLARFAGVQVNLGKTKVWNRAATRPEDLHHWSRGVER